MRQLAPSSGMPAAATERELVLELPCRIGDLGLLRQEPVGSV